jgi:hypothetical protein
LAPMPASIRPQAAAARRPPLHTPAYRPLRLRAAGLLPACQRRPQASTASAEVRGCRRWAGDYFLSPPLIQFYAPQLSGCMFDLEKGSTRIETGARELYRRQPAFDRRGHQ